MKLAGSINHWRADPSGWIGSVIMLGFAGIAAWRWQGSGLLFYALTFLRDVAAGWFLLTRRKDLIERRFGAADVLAYVSSALPLLYFGPAAGVSASMVLASNLLVIAGFAFATVALFELGPAFGVSPANRGHVESGIYRFIRHPMYTGYAAAEVGLALLNPLNLIVLFPSLCCYVLRSRRESRLLSIPAHLASSIKSSI